MILCDECTDMILCDLCTGSSILPGKRGCAAGSDEANGTVR